MARRDRTSWGLAAIVLVGALVRFGTLDAKSFWLDEALTLERLHLGFGDMLHAVRIGEPNPPGYFVVAWAWVRVAGFGEVGLRSLSALAGTLTIVVAFAVARRLVGRRAALVAAALVALNPFLVWYSQEGRTYALFALVGAVSVLAFLRVLEDRTPRRLAVWAAACVLTLATHYFAVFLIVAEAAWLLWDSRSSLSPPRVAALAIAPAAAVAVAVSQSTGEPAAAASFGGARTILKRLVTTPGELLAGFEAPHIELLAAGAALPLALGVLLAARAAPDARRGALLAASLAAAVVALPLAAAAVGRDFFAARNVILCLVPVLVVAAAGFTAPRAGPVGPVAAVVLGVVSAVTIASSAWTPKYQAHDWRNVAAAMGPSRGPRAVVVAPDLGARALGLYLPGGLLPLGAGSSRVTEVDVVAMARGRGSGRTAGRVPPVPAAPQLPAPGFVAVEVERERWFTLIRFRAPAPRRVTAAISGAGAFSKADGVAYLEPR